MMPTDSEVASDLGQPPRFELQELDSMTCIVVERKTAILTMRLEAV